MQNHATQDMHHLKRQLNCLLDKVRAGASGNIIAEELQAALASLDEMVRHDAVTGVLNRRGLMQKLTEELDRSKRTGHSFSFAVIAVDEFPSLNACYGSEIGKQILVVLAQVTLGVIRSLDSFGRIGEHEFALILPTTWLDQSDKAIARLTNAVAAWRWDEVAPGLKISFSSGMTSNVAGDTAEHMLSRATEALALAQIQGVGSRAQLEAALPDFDLDLL